MNSSGTGNQPATDDRTMRFNKTFVWNVYETQGNEIIKEVPTKVTQYNNREEECEGRVRLTETTE